MPRSKRDGVVVCWCRSFGRRPAEGEPLDVEEAGGALQVGEALGILAVEPVELGAARELPAQHVHQRLVMVLQDAEEGGDVAADIVEDLDLRRLLPREEDAGHAGEDLAVEGMAHGRDAAGELARELPLAADIAGDRLGGGDVVQGKRSVHGRPRRPPISAAFLDERSDR